MSTVPSVRVAFADDAPTIRAILRFFLAKDSLTELAGEATNSLDIVQVCHAKEPAVVLLDLHMPGPPLPVTLQSLYAYNPDIKIIILTDEQDERLVQEVSRLPVSGYVIKSDIAHHLLAAIHTVAAGGQWYSSVIRPIFTAG